MAKGFRGPEIVKEIDAALDKGLARFLINTQSKLSASSPVDTGRLASSWFVGKGVPNRDQRQRIGRLRTTQAGRGREAQLQDHDGIRLVDQQQPALCRTCSV